MRTVAITTLGCKINQFESAAMGDALGREGFTLVPFDGLADIYVINTCTVTARTDAESRRLIRRAVRTNPAARVVVTGCYAQVAFEELSYIPGVSLVIGNAEKKGIVDLLKEAGPEQRVLVSDISREREAAGSILESFSEHTRAFLQVQNGCDARCSYCIVPSARGPSRSVPPAEVLAAIAEFARRGFREVVLTGIHLGAYGLDLSPPARLLDLLRETDRARLVPRLRLGSIEPTEFDEELITFVACSPAICPHFHIPLQSGSDRVLARMNRHYSTAEYAEVVGRLAKALPEACLGADVIAGFPGESDEEFAESMAFVESLPLAYLHVFPFSRRDGTPAAGMSGQVSPAVTRERARLLRKLSDRKRRDYYRRFVGRELSVLVQEEDGEGGMRGLTRNYLTVRLPARTELANQEVLVRIVDVVRDEVRGELVR